MNYFVNTVKKVGPLLIAAVLSLGVLQKVQANYTEVDTNDYRTITTYFYDDGRPYYRTRTNTYGPINERFVRTVINTDKVTKKILRTQTYTTNYFKDELYRADGLPYRYYKRLNYGPSNQRLIDAFVIVDPNTGLYKEIQEMTATETRIMKCNSKGLPYSTSVFKTDGPILGRVSTIRTIFNSNTELPKYSKKTNDLGEVLSWYDSNGLLTRRSITNTYSLPGERTITMTYTTDSKTGLPKKHEAITVYTKSVCTYDRSGLITQEVKTTPRGPINDRIRTILYSYDSATGMKKRSISTSALETRIMKYKDDLPLIEDVVRNYGPSSLRLSTRILDINSRTGLLSKSYEQDAMKMVVTTYKDNGEKKEAQIFRKYGLAGSRVATIKYFVSTTSGLTYKAVETSSAEVKTCYYRHGKPYKMVVDRNYGPTDKRKSTILYTCNSSNGLITKSTETTSLSVKTLYHNSNGVADHGTFTTNTGSAEMRNFTITIISDAATGKYKEERYENKNYSIRLYYNSDGVPNKRKTFKKLGDWMILVSTDILEDGDEVGSTEVIAAAVAKIDQKKNIKKDSKDLPEAELEYEEIEPKRIPISGKRLGIPQYMQKYKNK